MLARQTLAKAALLQLLTQQQVDLMVFGQRHLGLHATDVQPDLMICQ
jgi:hypothetical protein